MLKNVFEFIVSKMSEFIFRNQNLKNTDSNLFPFFTQTKLNLYSIST
jgi:hypothetical protein